MAVNNFKLSGKDIDEFIETLDETGGLLVKEGELKRFTEKIVNRENKKTVDECIEAVGRAFKKIWPPVSFNDIKDELEKLKGV